MFLCVRVCYVCEYVCTCVCMYVCICVYMACVFRSALCACAPLVIPLARSRDELHRPRPNVCIQERPPFCKYCRMQFACAVGGRTIHTSTCESGYPRHANAVTSHTTCGTATGTRRNTRQTWAKQGRYAAALRRLVSADIGHVWYAPLAYAAGALAVLSTKRTPHL